MLSCKTKLYERVKKKMVAYTEKQKVLMQRWRSMEHHEGKEFIEDGIIDFSRWQKSKSKVMFFLKEAYGGAVDLCQIIREEWQGPKYKIWWTASYWLYAINKIQNGGIPVFPETSDEINECIEMLLSSAIVNIKKSGGKSWSDQEELNSYVSKDMDLLKEQVELISPEIIITGNTFECFKTIYPDSVKPVGSSGFIWQENGRKIINFWHPANQFPDKLCFNGLCWALFESKFF